MLCSVATTKSGPNWLDRLRSNKGFPSGDNLDLDHFLSRNPNSSPEFPSPNAESVPPEAVRAANRSDSSDPTRDNERGEALLGLMSNAISELFFIDGSEESSRLSGKKIPRKQTHPRVCNTSNTNTTTTTEDKSIGNDVNVLITTPSLNSDNRKELNEEEEELEEKGERELKGYSKSEVTVIDTSCAVWKTEKVVFRRKSVWKVREKKTKLRSFGRNKRKVVVAEQGDDIDNKNKEAKVSPSDGDQCISLNPIEGQNSQNDARKEVYNDTTDNLDDRGKELSKDDMPNSNKKEIEKGFPLNRLPRKMIRDGSSVVFIKGIPTDEKNEGKLPKKCLKDGQRKYKA